MKGVLFWRCGDKVDGTFNLVVTSGENLIAQILGGVGVVVRPGHIAVGSGSDQPLASNEALQTEVARQATQTTVISNTVEYSCQFPAGTATGTLREFGLFAGNTLVARAVADAPIQKTATDALDVTWALTFQTKERVNV